MGIISKSLLIVLVIIFVVKSCAFNRLVSRSLLRPKSSFLNRDISPFRPSISYLKFKVSEGDEDVEFDESIEFDEFKPSSNIQKLSRSIIPLAASLGFAVTPSSGVAIRLAGAAAGGVAGLVTKMVVLDKLVREEERKNSATDDGDDDTSDGGGGGAFLTPQVATLLKKMEEGPPLMSYNLKKLESVAKKTNLPGNLLCELFTNVFAEAVLKVQAVTLILTSTKFDNSSFSFRLFPPQVLM